jgi:hypothetical protein
MGRVGQYDEYVLKAWWSHPPPQMPPVRLSVNNRENSQYLFILTVLSKCTQMPIFAHPTSFPGYILFHRIGAKALVLAVQQKLGFRTRFSRWYRNRKKKNKGACCIPNYLQRIDLGIEREMCYDSGVTKHSIQSADGDWIWILTPRKANSSSAC